MARGSIKKRPRVGRYNLNNSELDVRIATHGRITYVKLLN